MSNEALKQFVNSVVSGNDDNVNHFKQYAIEKTKNIVSEYKARAVFEAAFAEFAGNSPIQINGDDVLINGKIVGHIQYDLNDIDSGINFIRADGNYSKEFNTLESLYAYLTDQFGIKEGEIKSLDLCDELDLHKTGDVDTGKKPENTDAEGSTSPRLNKLKGIISSIKSGGRPDSTKVTESKWNMKNKDVDKDKTSKLKKNVDKMKKEADKNGNKE